MNFHFSNPSSISIQLKHPDPTFLKTIAKLDFVVAPSLDSNFSHIHILGSSIVSLSTFIEQMASKKLPYNTIARLVWCLYSQQLKLYEAGHSFFNLTLEDVVVIDGWHFFCANPNLCRPISSDGSIKFLAPFSKNRFSSPEILKISHLPSSVSVETFYYSLASLAFFCFFRKHYLDTVDELESIKYTKLYWFFKRALAPDSKRRHCILL